MTHVDPFWVNVLVAFIIPMLVALITAKVASDGVKAITLAVLAALGTALAQVLNGDFVWDTFLKSFVLVFLGAVGLHYGLLKNIRVTGSQGGIQNSITGGIGAAPAAPPQD